jgi:hypothetical protein
MLGRGGKRERELEIRGEGKREGKFNLRFKDFIKFFQKKWGGNYRSSWPPRV